MSRSRSVAGVLALVFFGLMVVSGCGTAEAVKGHTGQKAAAPAKLRIFKPDELLSQTEAAELTGHPVTLKTDTLAVDRETGSSTTYYEYDLPGGTTLNAGLFLHQNSAAREPIAENAFEGALRFVKRDSKPVQGLGDKAFYQPSVYQMHVLYRGIYFIVAFEDKDETKNEDLNLRIARKVLDNVTKKN